jgi:hypothetical protein
MLITIRHLPRETYRDMSCIYDDEQRARFAKEELKNNNYIRVADIELIDENIDKSLSLAYELTNSIDSAWYDNADIDVANNAKEGCRSTSVGDIIQIQGKSYMVAGCGFIEISKDCE